MKKTIIVIIAIILLAIVVSAENILVVKTSQEDTDKILKDESYYTTLGNYLMKKGETEKALQIYELALKISPENEKILNNIGVYYVNKGEDDKAIEYFQKAVQQNKDYVTARNNLAVIYNEKEIYSEAIEQLRILVELEPTNPSYNYDLGINIATNIRENEIGDINEAIKYLEITNNIEPGFSHTKENLEVLDRVKALSQ
ncbi:MAG: tetratricopeptide repeat protein [Nanoarchaeota archaeon]|nr:tetratricopeptide repeat protein [Nanoarchaeota archaeon]